MSNVIIITTAKYSSEINKYNVCTTEKLEVMQTAMNSLGKG